MSKRKLEGSANPVSKLKQLNVRVPVELAERIELTAKGLATDTSHLLRMLIAENLPTYELRAQQAQTKGIAK